MLYSFKFKNFMSYIDCCEFTMVANKDKTHEENLISINKDRLSKAKIIYGANASGKSSFIEAMLFVSSFILNSNFLLDKKKIMVTPFKFREDCYNVPSEFAITFIKDGLKYYYEFTCTRDKVINEKLDIFYSAKPTTIFERTDTTEYKFTKDVKLLNEFKTKNSDNKLFLVTSATWNYEKTKPVVDYLLNTIMVITDIDRIWKQNIDKILADNELEEFKTFCLNFLKNADISIMDFKVDAKKIKDMGEEAKLFSDIMRVISKGNEELVSDAVNNTSLYDFITYHDINVENKIDRFILKLSEESLGTVQMFRLASSLYYVFKEGKVLFVDELDRSLHPLLVKHIVKMFLNNDINRNNAQLIANTHDTNLLDLNMFRRDELWFAEKDYESGSTKMFALSDFSPRKGENIEKAYLLGRFGAIPFIQEN